MFRHLLLTAHVAFLSASFAQTVSFSKSSYPAGATPRAVVAADFSGNGTIDLAVANSGDSTVLVLKGSTTPGSFDAGQASRTASDPRALAAGDLNRDGKPDLAVACAGANMVSVLWGAGGGAFSNRTDLAAGKAPVSVVIADFNADGRLDIAVANSGSDTVSVFLGNGAGSFLPRADYPVGKSPGALVAADFDRDGRMDLAVVNTGDNTISILSGNGNGTFGTKTDLPTGAGPAGLLAGNFDPDGALDLAVVNSSDGTVSIFRGDGGGAFSARKDYPAGANPSAVTAADFNGDGKIDLAVTSSTGNAISILLGDGAGAFRLDSTVAAGKTPGSLIVLDRLPDAKPGLAVVNSGSNDISICLNTTSPWSTQPPLSRMLGVSGAAWGGVVGFDTDGTSYFNYTPDSFQCFGLASGSNYKDTYPTVANNGKVAFQSDRDGTGSRIFVVNLDGTGVQRLTLAEGLSNPSAQQDTDPVISHDGGKVAFLRRSDPSLGNDIYLVKTDGTGLQKVTTYQPDPQGKGYSGIFSVAWNDDGTKLAFRGVRVEGGTLQQVLGIVNPDGTGEQHLAAWPSIGWPSYALDWSADGRRMVFSGDSVQDPNLYHFVEYPSLKGSSISTATLVSPSTDLGSVRLSPDGQWLVYQMGNPQSGSWPAFIRVDGTGLAVLDQLNFARGQPLYWTPIEAAGVPDHIEVSPNPLYVWTDHSATVNARLVDAGGNVLVGAVAGWQLPGLNGAAPRFSPTGEVFAGAGVGDWELDAVNAGLKGSTIVKVRDAPDFSLSMRRAGDLMVGGRGVYTLTVSNASGSAPNPDAVTVTDTLPPGLTYVSASGSGWSCSAAGANVSCNHAGPIDEATSTDIILTVSVEAAAFPGVTNTATVSTSQDTNHANDSATDTAPVAIATSSGPRIDAVVNGVTWRPEITSGSWAALFGAGLAGTSRLWRADDFVNGNLPTSLDGVQVSINGKAALICYISPTQANVLVPDDDTLGVVAVEIVYNGLRARAFVELRAFGPGFFAYWQGGGKYAIAQDTEWNWLAKVGLLGTQGTRGARPGEIIILWGAGFGPANPRQPAATVVSEPKPLANTVRVTIGGVEAPSYWIGQTGPGLCQIMVTVPDVPDGDQPLSAEVAGVSSSGASLITIQR